MPDYTYKILGSFGGMFLAWLFLARVGRYSLRMEMIARDNPPRRHVVRPGGKWEGAPIPEIDKSTTGRLLAGRVRRNPEIEDRVATHPSPADDHDRRDGMWDLDLDG